jgi:hypothetical protein
LVVVSGQLHALAALPLGKKPQVPIGYEVGWTPEPVWTKWRREILDPSVIKAVASRYTDCAIEVPVVYRKICFNSLIKSSSYSSPSVN